jgi:hypothetical protein
MAKLEDLIKQIPDAKLRAEVAREVVVLEAHLTDAARERGRLAAVMSTVGGSDGE